MVKSTRNHRAKNVVSLTESKLLLRLDHLQNLVGSQAANTIKQIEAYLGIQHYLATGQLLPDFHGWPVCPDFGLYLIKRLETQAYDLVVEFGSGTSSWLIANVRKRREFQHLAFDHLEQYWLQTKSKLEADGLLDHIHLKLTPLVPCVGADGINYLYYDCASALAEFAKDINQKGKRVLVMIDGPPAATGPHARYPALQHVLAQYPLAEIDFLLDDFIRLEEQEILQTWKKHLSDLNVSHKSHIFRMEKDAALLSVTQLTP